MNPILPHLSNECLEIIKENNEVIWPKYDEKQLEESSCLIVIQINGKKRGLINTNLNVTEKEIMELIYKDEKISKYLIDSNIKKQIYIKNKLINIIINFMKNITLIILVLFLYSCGYSSIYKNQNHKISKLILLKQQVILR